MTDESEPILASENLPFAARSGVFLGHIGLLVTIGSLCLGLTDWLANSSQLFWWVVSFIATAYVATQAELKIGNSLFAAGFYTGLFAVVLGPLAYLTLSSGDPPDADDEDVSLAVEQFDDQGEP